MNEAAIQQREGPARRTAAVLFACLLNLALLPCSMALEVAEKAHDCCPPQLELEAWKCCAVDDVSIDSRGDVIKFDDKPDAIAPLSLPHVSEIVGPRETASADPPGDPDTVKPLHKIHCVYLN